MNKLGNVCARWQDELFIVELSGAFNEKGMESGFSHIQQCIDQKDIKSWKRLEIWDQEVLGSPEIVEMGRLVYQWYKANGCYKTAYVVTNGIQKHVIEQMLQGDSKIFTNLEEASQWLADIH